MRPVKACLQCRTGKRRCDQVGTSACSQCLQRNLPCSAARDELTESPTSPPLPVLSARSSEEMHLVDLYFRFIHDQPHSLFHEPSFKASVVAGTVSQHVLLGMMGLSARYKHRQRCFVVLLLARTGLTVIDLQRGPIYGPVDHGMRPKPRQRSRTTSSASASTTSRRVF